MAATVKRTTLAVVTLVAIADKMKRHDNKRFIKTS